MVGMFAAAFGMSAATSASDGIEIPGGDRTDVRPVTQQTRLVTFAYNPDVSYSIRSLEGVFTNIEVPAGETVQGFYLSDATNWAFHVTADKRRVLVKPAMSGTVNTGTLVTENHTFELTLSSVAAGALWHQRVRWSLPSEGGHDVAGSGIYWSGASLSSPADQGPSVSPDKLNFGYQVRGRNRSTVRPTVVFDDGVRTWFAFEEGQDIPAIFATDRRGRNMDVVEFAMRGRYVVVPHIAEGFVLRIGREEARVVRQ